MPTMGGFEILFILALVIITILLISYFAFGEYQDRKKVKISESFNSITINYLNFKI